MVGNNHIEITINGEPKKVASGLNVVQLLAELQITNPAVAVELNAAVVAKNEFKSVSVQAGDVVEIVSLVGGG